MPSLSPLNDNKRAQLPRNGQRPCPEFPYSSHEPALSGLFYICPMPNHIHLTRTDIGLAPAPSFRRRSTGVAMLHPPARSD